MAVDNVIQSWFLVSKPVSSYTVAPKLCVEVLQLQEVVIIFISSECPHCWWQFHCGVVWLWMSFCTFTPWLCGGEKLCVMVCSCVRVIFCRCSLVESCVWILRNQVEVIVSVATISAAVVSLLLWLLLFYQNWNYCLHPRKELKFLQGTRQYFFFF